jgi:hypothetical protein
MDMNQTIIKQDIKILEMNKTIQNMKLKELNATQTINRLMDMNSTKELNSSSKVQTNTTILNQIKSIFQ